MSAFHATFRIAGPIVESRLVVIQILEVAVWLLCQLQRFVAEEPSNSLCFFPSRWQLRSIAL
jgi:hypothetical protein